MSWCKTYKMPCRHSRSSTGFGPGDRSGQGGSSGSIRAHKSSSTIHGRVVTRRERPNHHIGHARPGHLNKIVLRALTGTAPQNVLTIIRPAFSTNGPRECTKNSHFSGNGKRRL